MKTKFDQILTTTMRTHFKTNIRSDNIFTSVSGKFMKIKKEDYLSIFKSGLTQYER